MTAEDPAKGIRLSVDLPVPAEIAWSLITDNAHIARWWGAYATLEPVLGGSFRETWSNGSREVVTSGRVLAFEPPARLLLSWADDDWPGATTVAFAVSEAPAGARVGLVHDGWQVHPAGRRAPLMADHAAGWRHHLDNLAAHAAGLAAT